MKNIFLSLYILFAALSPALADVIVTDDAVVVQSDRAASRAEDNREDLQGQSPVYNGASGPTVVKPNGDIEINSQSGAPQLLDNDDNRSRGDKILVVPDQN